LEQGRQLKMPQEEMQIYYLYIQKRMKLNLFEEGLGIKRFDLMYNDFVIVGPRADPAKNKKI